MKKMAVIVIVALVAMCSQAASIAWNMNGYGLKDADGNVLSLPTGTSLALVVMDSATGWDSATEIPIGTGSEATTLAINSTNGRVTGKVQFTYTDGGDNLINNGDYLALMFKDAEGTLSQLTYTTGEDEGNAVDATWQVSGLANNSTSLTSKKIMATGNFTAAVPEPTTGVLMLLGIAGLALRRRRA